MELPSFTSDLNLLQIDAINRMTDNSEGEAYMKQSAKNQLTGIRSKILKEI